MNKVEKNGLFFAAASVFAWSLTGIFVRLLPGFSGLFITGFRFLLASLVTLPFVIVDRNRRGQIAPTLRKPIAWWLGAALVLFYYLAVVAYQYGTVGEVALLLGTPPVFVILAKVVTGSLVSGREKIGTTVALLGVATVLAPKLTLAHGFSKGRLIGIVLAVLSAAASAHYTAKIRTARQQDETLDATVLTLMGFAMGAVGSLLASFALGQVPVAALHGHALTIFVELSVISTAFPSVAYALASQKLPATLTTTSQLMIPVIATIAAAMVLRELPSFWLLPGGALVLFGIIYMFREPATAKASSEKIKFDEATEFAIGD